MLSFVRRMNPFRRIAPPPPPHIVTKSVQADIDGPYKDSQHIVVNARATSNARREINKLLRELEKKNLAVATLMDQDGRIFFTIDLTEIINQDEELNKIVKLVQESIIMSNHSMQSDELSKKLKLHFLFESIKKMDQAQTNMNSSNYYTVAEKDTESEQEFREKEQRFAKETPFKNKRNIEYSGHYVDEREIKSLLYEATSTMSPEESLKLLEILKSSLATKIYKRIEETIKDIKRKHNFGNEEMTNRNNRNKKFSEAYMKHKPTYEEMKRNHYVERKKEIQKNNTKNLEKPWTKRTQTRRNMEFRRPPVVFSSSSKLITSSRRQHETTSEDQHIKISPQSSMNIRKESGKAAEVVQTFSSVYQPTKNILNIHNELSQTDKSNHLPLERKEFHKTTRRPTALKNGQRVHKPTKAVEKMSPQATTAPIATDEMRTNGMSVDVVQHRAKLLTAKREIMKKLKRNTPKNAKGETDSKRHEEKQTHKVKECQDKKKNDRRHEQGEEKNCFNSVLAEDKDEELTVFYTNTNIARKPHQSKRKSDKKKVKGLPTVTEELCHVPRKTRRQSKRKDNSDETRNSEVLLAVTSF